MRFFSPEPYVVKVKEESEFYSNKINKALENSLFDVSKPFLKTSYVELIDNTNTRLDEESIQRYFSGMSLSDVSLPRSWLLGENKDIAALSALGSDHRHHFVNSFIIGWKPFEVEDYWVPHYITTMRLKYQSDQTQFTGLSDLWLTSKEVFETGIGDCEDHSLFLADWLIEMGLDARVVLGRYGTAMHAWVVIFHSDGVFLLEATEKAKIKNLKAYPLAALATDYHPQYMFNNKYLWTNTGSTYTTNYVSRHWKKISRLIFN
ncbi:MAG: transglutaminase-like domain-containing protein [Candidatus Omnitrophica bacterium]|nr:transglutaminase-like domain-containing protein [Candidatus Omnitrophota bacterium]